MTEFSNILRKLRRNADMTQKQLGEILGVTSAAIGKYESVPNSYPSVEVIIKIADIFHVSIDYLLRGTESNVSAENNVNGVTNSTVIQANRGGTVFHGEQSISPEAEELLHIYDKLGVRERLKLLNFAVDLEEKSKLK